MIKVVLGIVAVLAIGIGYTQVVKNKALSPTYNQSDHEQPTNKPSAQDHKLQNKQQESSGGYGFKKPFYQEDSVSLQHYWPGEGSFSNEETEILLLNESGSSLEVKSFDLTYKVEEKTYPHKSGTWEKFPSIQSWDKIEYLNISPQYYKGEPLILESGQKGKLHWHIQFGPNPLDGKQTVKVKLTLFMQGQTVNIAEKFTRSSGTAFSTDDH